MNRHALLLIPIQNDFLPGGALAVPGGGDEIIPISNALDALECGFKVNVHLAACRGVDLQAADCDMAVAAMREHGAVIR